MGVQTTPRRAIRRHPVLEEKPRLEEIKQGLGCRVPFFFPPVGLKTHVGGVEALHS